MNKVEFIKGCAARGYSTKKQAEAYCKIHKKTDYTENDMQDVYRSANSMKKGDYNPEHYEYESLNGHGGRRKSLNFPRFDQ